MELKISNRITRKVNSLKWKWGLYKIRFSMWKIGFNLKTMNIRIALNPKIIKLKVGIKFRRIGWKLYRAKIKFRTWKCNVKNKMIEDLKPIGEILGILFAVFFMVFIFDVMVLGIAQCFGFLMDWKIV